MKKILIINLKRFGDIYATSHLVSSIKSQYHGASVSLLVFEEFAKATTNMLSIDKVFTLNRNKITKAFQQPVYPATFSLELLKEVINEIQDCGFDTIINYSNDSISTQICSYFKNTDVDTNIIGVYQDLQNRVVTSNYWASLMNDVLPGMEESPISFLECYHRMTNIPYVAGNEIKVAIRDNYSLHANRYFKEIREALTGNNGTVQLVGIQLLTSDIKKDIPETALIQLIEKLLDDARLYPILLIAPFAVEKEYAEKINKLFNQSLIIVEADFEALASTLIHLDVLVTPDTVTKHLANLTSTPLVEYSVGSSPASRQSSVLQDDIVLTPDIGCYPCSAKKDCRINPKHVCQKFITAKDIYSAVLARLNYIPLNQIKIEGAVRTFKVGMTDSHFPTPIIFSGQAHLAREYVYKLAGINYKSTTSLTANEATIESDNLSLAMKNTLQGLREISAIKRSGKPSRMFSTSLQNLLDLCHTKSAAAIACKLARSEIENLRGSDITQNAVDAEIILQKLKSNLHLLSEILLGKTAPQIDAP